MVVIKKLVFSRIPAFAGMTNYIKPLLLTRHPRQSWDPEIIVGFVEKLLKGTTTILNCIHVTIHVIYLHGG